MDLSKLPFANLSSVEEFNSIINTEDPNLLKLNISECILNDQHYKVVRYDKTILNVGLIPKYGLFRSVILNGNNVLAFSPPKSIPPDCFIHKYSKNIENIRAEEFIEGTMINVFWDKIAEIWEISTRNTVGANSSFYKGENFLTFRSMFFEAAAENKLILENLNKLYCYSFVLQHPKNRIVVPFKTPTLYLVAVYHINDFDKTNVTVYYHDMKEVRKYDWNGSTIQFPKIYEFNKYSDLIEKYASMNTPYDIVGVVLYNTVTGERSKIRNPVYEQVKSLRGNQPKLQYQYLCLRGEDRVREFLKYFPENKKEFSEFRSQIHLFTETLYYNYRSCYVKKEKPLNEFSDQYRTHMFKIHEIFMNELREKKLFITKTHVINYVNKLHPSLLMHCLNYNMRKRSVDYIRADNN
jgi:hypothetical protein